MQFVVSNSSLVTSKPRYFSQLFKMARRIFLLVPLVCVLISNYVDSQGISVDVESGKNINADLIHELAAHIESKVETSNNRQELHKYIDGTLVWKIIESLSKELTKEETHYLIQELEKRVELLPNSRVARQVNTTPVKITKITYNLGKRLPGDRIVASNSVSQQWTSAQNVSQSLSYPRAGVGSVITYVEVIVEKTSNLGSASAPTGGIGQRFISIIINAQNTLQYRATTVIYGF